MKIAQSGVLGEGSGYMWRIAYWLLTGAVVGIRFVAIFEHWRAIPAARRAAGRIRRASGRAARDLGGAGGIWRGPGGHTGLGCDKHVVGL